MLQLIPTAAYVPGPIDQAEDSRINFLLSHDMSTRSTRSIHTQSLPSAEGIEQSGDDMLVLRVVMVFAEVIHLRGPEGSAGALTIGAGINYALPYRSMCCQQVLQSMSLS